MKTMSPAPNNRSIVIDTTPLIALAAATGSLEILKALYGRIVVPFEVREEMLAAGRDATGVAEFKQATWLDCRDKPIDISPFIANSLDRGEASVIQTAIHERTDLVCIDETVGRRIARLSGLALTGSIGILIKAKRQGYSLAMPEALEKMRQHGIRLSAEVVRFALSQTR